MAKNAKSKKARLGRGLSSLMSAPAVIDAPVVVDAPAVADAPAEASAAAGVAGDALAAGDAKVAASAAAGAAVADADVAAVGEGVAPLPPGVVDEPIADVLATDSDEAGVAAEATIAEAISRASSNKVGGGESGAADIAGGGLEGADAAEELSGGGLVWIDVLEIRPNQFQPRRIFDEQALDSLAESIRQDGVMQPIIVRRATDGEGYEIVAGERRWRAAQRAEAHTVPALVRDLDDCQVAEWAIVENLQREDLNPIERAHAFKRLSESFELTHEQVAGRVGINRSTVTNTLRLLDLHLDIQVLVQAGKLSAGHSRALLGISDLEAQAIVGKKVADEGWSVRVTEAEVKRLVADPTAAPSKPSVAKKEAREAHLVDLEERIGTHLQTKVRLKTGRKKGAGSITIEFYDFEHFDNLLNAFGVQVEEA